MKTVYVIDLDQSLSKLEVLELEGAELEKDLAYAKAEHSLYSVNSHVIKKLQNSYGYDRKVFKTEKYALNYLQKYKEILSSLDNNKICKSKNLPNMLYKRRYIIQTLLGEKMQTYRHYKKPWKIGQLFNLYDQTYFLTVKLISLKEVEKGQYKYEFQVQKNK